MANIQGQRQLQRNIQRIQRNTKTKLEEALTKSALIVERSYKENVSQAGLVDTGRWLNSITHKENNYGTNNPSVQIGSTIQDPEYPKLHEFGTSKFPATPTLFPAYNNNKQKILKELAKAIRQGMSL